MAYAAWRSDAVRTVGLSFGLSLGLHLALLALLVTSFSRTAARTPLVVQRVRLVYVDAAPAAAPRGTVQGVADMPPAPVAVPVPPVPQRALSATAKKLKPVPPVDAPAPREAIEPSTPAVEVAPVPAVPAGVASGVVGGHGEALGDRAEGAAGGRGAGSGVLRLGDVATAPVLVTRVVPEYPRRARLAGIEGEVVLEVIVDRYGRVTSDVRVVAAVPELERAAVAAVQRWRFRPARDRDGTAVAVLMEVPVRFVLHEATADASR